MTTETKQPETNYQSTIRMIRESMARDRAALMADPQYAAMAKAHELTKDELAQIADAEAKVADAEATVNAASIVLDRARRGMAPESAYDAKRPFGVLQKRPDTYRAASESIPGLEGDLAEARTALQTAIRRRNLTVRSIDLARSERRRAAKVKHAPKPTPVRFRNVGWGTAEGLDAFGGEGTE